MAVKAVDQPSNPATGAVFFHGQRHHIANAALVKIAVMRMVDGMGAPPDVIGRQRQHAQTAADPVLHLAIVEKAGVAAVMLDDKDAHEEQPVQRGNGEGQPVAD